MHQIFPTGVQNSELNALSSVFSYQSIESRRQIIMLINIGFRAACVEETAPVLI